MTKNKKIAIIGASALAIAILGALTARFLRSPESVLPVVRSKP